MDRLQRCRMPVLGQQIALNGRPVPTRQKTKNLRRDPNTTLFALDPDDNTVRLRRTGG
jgi:hypothetical protein